MNESDRLNAIQWGGFYAAKRLAVLEEEHSGSGGAACGVEGQASELSGQDYVIRVSCLATSARPVQRYEVVIPAPSMRAAVSLALGVYGVRDAVCVGTLDEGGDWGR